jgi:hypothetical protein
MMDHLQPQHIIISFAPFKLLKLLNRKRKKIDSSSFGSQQQQTQDDGSILSILKGLTSMWHIRDQRVLLTNDLEKK